MQAGSSTLLRSFHVATRNIQMEFHTSACALKYGSRFKKKPLKVRNSSQLTRSPSQKRLVPTLKPTENLGTYEVAPRRSRSRDGARQKVARSLSSHEETFPSNTNGFARDSAPHVGRVSWLKSNKSPLSFRRASKPTREMNPRSRTAFDPLPSLRRRESELNDGRHGSYDRTSPLRPVKGQPPPPLPEEFDTPSSEPPKTLPSRFSSPPLLDGLLQSIHEVLGVDTKPSPIQSLSLKHLFTPPSHVQLTKKDDERSVTKSLSPSWGQYLLASETGSGKSIAYLLPMIQHLKLTEHSPTLPVTATHRPVAVNPRGLILAPTHELSRQLSSFAKALLHRVRLRVLCASRANTSSSSRGRSSTARQLKWELDGMNSEMTGGSQIVKGSRPVDILVGTPMKILEMVRGWGWDKEGKIEEQWDDARKERARSWIPGPPEAGLANVEWVVVDEADILFDQDFQESTRMLLADISRARGYSHPSFSSLKLSSDTPTVSPTSPSEPLVYPFHFLLTSATIPSSLADYLTTNHPTLTRLASPNLHHLPSTLRTEHHAWTSGNKNADIEKRIRRAWADDASIRSKSKSKILIFCNKSSKVEDLGLYLTEKGIPNIALTSSGQARHRGSNRHLAGFLKATNSASLSLTTLPSVPEDPPSPPLASPSDPRVMITTSLLSRGLDFSPQIKHVFIVDEPRNMIDFLHRAGRAGRAGHEGKVVVFGKMKGRGSKNATEIKRKIGALAS